VEQAPGSENDRLMPLCVVKVYLCDATGLRTIHNEPADSGKSSLQHASKSSAVIVVKVLRVDSDEMIRYDTQRVLKFLNETI